MTDVDSEEPEVIDFMKLAESTEELADKPNNAIESTVAQFMAAAKAEVDKESSPSSDSLISIADEEDDEAAKLFKSITEKVEKEEKDEELVASKEEVKLQLDDNNDEEESDKAAKAMFDKISAEVEGSE